MTEETTKTVAETQATSMVPAAEISDFLNSKWTEGFMPRQDDMPTAMNPAGDMTITVYAKDDTAISTSDRPWSVLHSSTGHAERLEAGEKTRGYTLYYAPIAKPSADSDTQAKEDPMNHTRIVMIFFKGALANSTSATEIASSDTTSTTPVSESKIASSDEGSKPESIPTTEPTPVLA